MGKYTISCLNVCMDDASTRSELIRRSIEVNTYGKREQKNRKAGDPNTLCTLHNQAQCLLFGDVLLDPKKALLTFLHGFEG